MIIPAGKRVSSRAFAGPFATGQVFDTATPGGPAGSALMTFFAIMVKTGASLTTEIVFGRFGGAGNGWIIENTSAGLHFYSTNGAGAFVVSPSVILTPNIPVVCVAVYNNGTITGWINAVSMGSTTLGNGYTASATATRIGLLANRTRILECGMLDGYDATATIAALTAQWQEDLQQGRYLTWPRVMTVNDWNWSARDVVVAAGGTKATWTDRGPNASVATRAGSPIGGSTPMVF